MKLINQSNTASRNLSLRAAALAICTLSAGAVQAQASAQAAQKQAEDFWYVQGSLGNLKSSHSELSVKLSDVVQVSGSSFFDQGRTGSIVLGRQTIHQEQWNHDIPGRWELEAWQGSAKRSSVRVGALSANPGDTVKARALIANFMGRIAESDEKGQNRLPLWRTWFGVGLGWGTVEYPSLTLSNCNCLRAAESDGDMVVQAKLAVERYVAQDTAVFVQAARIWFPGASYGSGPYPRTQYGDWGLTTYSVGVRVGFR